MQIKKKALKLLEEGKIEQIRDQELGTSFDVGKYYVRIFNKPGRTLITCSCQNHARYCDENPLCSHKLAVIKFWMENEK